MYVCVYDCFDLEDKLKIEKKWICTQFEFFTHMVKEYPILG